MDGVGVHQPDILPNIELEGITKYFGITHALNNVNVKLYPGQVVGLVGANGAGKSTLMKVILGVEAPTAGKIHLNGEDASQHHYMTMVRQNGISCAYQELSLCTNLNVYGNYTITYTKQEKSGKERKNEKQVRQLAGEMLNDIFPGHGINLAASVLDHTIAQRQMVEISRAISMPNLSTLILDEPTSSLTSDRINQLHSAIRNLTKRNVLVIYISHKLEEIKQISDRLILMKNGQITLDCPVDEVSVPDIVRHLGGNQERKEAQTQRNACPGENEDRVSIKGLNTHVLKDIYVRASGGEILGIAGLAGEGQTDLLDAIFEASLKKRNKGVITVSGRLSFVSGDRKMKGVFHLWDIAHNITISGIDHVMRRGIVRKGSFLNLAQHWFDKLKFKAESVQKNISELSGGNQQKALIARGLASKADIVLLDDPTRGVDIETKQEIYRLLQEARAEGKTIIIYSTEDSELEICDRVYVMRGGRISAELSGSGISQDEIVKASFDKEAVKATASQDDKGRSDFFVRMMKRSLSARSLFPVLAFLVVFVIEASLNKRALSFMGLKFLFGAAAAVVFASMGQMFIIMVGNIDMGIGYAVAMINAFTAIVMIENFPLGLLCYAVFLLAYMSMGALIYLRKMPSIIVTLGASFIWYGMALILLPVPGGAAPEWLLALYNFRGLQLPVALYFCIAVCAIVLLVLFKTRYGTVMRGFGNDPKAVTYAGWSGLRVQIAAYFASGLCIIVSGLMFTAIGNGGDANAATSITMRSIVAVILGGCEFAGGIITPIGVLAGALTISFISSVLSFMNINTDMQTMIIGFILILVLSMKLFIWKREGPEK
jgi:ribose transport system ATP-binding protein